MNSSRKKSHGLKILIFLVLLGTPIAGVVATAAELPWPRFRGPNGSGIADNQNPPVEFGPDKNLKWKSPAPSGLSSPIVAGKNLIITAFEGGKLYTIAYNRKNGKEAWRATAPANQLEAFHKTEGSPATSTPATDGKHIVSYFGSCGLFCYNLSGKALWKLEMPPAATGGDFGSGVSPIITDGLVVLVRDEKNGSKIIALDAASGSCKWEQTRLSATSYCTPVVWHTTEGNQIVSAGHARMVGYDLKTGREKWFVNGMPAACIPSPVVANETLFFAGGGAGTEDQEFQMPSFDSMLKDLDKDNDGALSKEEADKALQGFFDNQDTNKDGKLTRDEWDAIIKFIKEGKNTAFALKTGGTGDVTSHVLWKKTKGLPWVTSALLYRGQYIMVKDGGIVTAYDAKTGDQVYQERIVAPGQYYASPVAANGHIYFTSLQDGTVTVLNAGSDKPQVLATNPKLGERTAATPAIADNALFIRTDKHLYAFAAKK
jgi:outer membrane protein assembly factor BamB